MYRGRKIEHRPGQETGDFFRFVDGNALGYDFTEDDRQIGDEGDDARQADRIGIIFQAGDLGDVFRQGPGHFRAPVDTGEQADQGNAELDHGKHLIRIFTQFQDDGRRFAAFIGQGFQPRLMAADDGHFQQRKDAIAKNQQNDDEKLFP